MNNNYLSKQIIKRSICMNLIAFVFYSFSLFTNDVVWIIFYSFLFFIPLLILSITYCYYEFYRTPKNLISGTLIQVSFILVLLSLSGFKIYYFKYLYVFNLLWIFLISFFCVYFIFPQQDKKEYPHKKIFIRTIYMNFISAIWFYTPIMIYDSSKSLKFMMFVLPIALYSSILGWIFSYFKLYWNKKGMITSFFIQNSLILFLGFILIFWKNKFQFIKPLNIISVSIITLICICCILPNQEQS